MKKHQFAASHSDLTPVQTCCTTYSVRPLRLKLQKTSRKKKAADRVSVLCRLVLKKKWERQALQWLFCTSSQTSLSGDVKLDIAWGELELANARGGTNYQACEQNCPNLMCAQWLQQQVSQTGERTVGGATCKVYLNKANKGGAKSRPTTSLHLHFNAAASTSTNKDG